MPPLPRESMLSDNATNFMGWFSPAAGSSATVSANEITKPKSAKNHPACSDNGLYEGMVNRLYERMSLCAYEESVEDRDDVSVIDLTSGDEESLVEVHAPLDDDMSLWSGYQSHNLSFENDKEVPYSLTDLLSFPHATVPKNVLHESKKEHEVKSFTRALGFKVQSANKTAIPSDLRDDGLVKSEILALNKRSSLTTEKLVQKGEAHYNKKEYVQALDCLKRARLSFSVKLGSDSQEAIDATVRTACIYMATNEVEQALSMFQFAKNMTSHVQTGKRGDLQIAYLSEEIALIQRGKGEYTEALKQIKTSLRLYKNHYGETHFTVAKSAAEIASLYNVMGEKHKALAVYTQVLKIQVALVGKLHPDVAGTLFELALLHDELGDTDRSMKITKKAYLIYNATVGENSLVATKVLSHFGNLYFKLDKKAKAFKAYGRTLHIRKALLGRNHELVADTLMDIGSLLRTQGQQQQAMQCMMEALDIYKKCQGDRTVAVSDVMNVIGMTYYDQGDCDNAIKMYTQVLNIRVNQLGEDHYAVANVLNNIGTVYSKKKDYENALRSYSTALRIYEKHEKRDHLKYAVTLVNIGTVMKGTGDHKKAEEAFRNALEICYEDVMLKSDHPVVLKANKGLESIKAAPYKADHIKQ